MADKQLLEKALHVARKGARGEIGKQRAKEIAPEFSKLWDLLPENREQAYQFWMMVAAILGVCLLAYQVFGGSRQETQGGNRPQTITVPQEIIDAIQSARPDGP
jgi:hypothetical protein